MTNDVAVKKWGQGEMHQARGRIVNAELEDRADGYVQARVVVVAG